MRLLDLFCGAGGAAAGYHRAGFTDIVGIDLEPQPHFPFTFVQADALEPPVDLAGFDAIHASPPCHAFSTVTGRNRENRRRYPDLVAETRERLEDAGVPYVIENVVGAPLVGPIRLCGSSFGLDVRRHRLFELGGWTVLLVPPCAHHWQTPRFRSLDSRRTSPASVIGVHGHLNYPGELELRQSAMGVDWNDKRGTDPGDTAGLHRMDRHAPARASGGGGCVSVRPDPSWMADAACRGVNVNIFFPGRETPGGVGPDAYDEARAICARCPVRAACLEYALTPPMPVHGMWGGLTQKELRQIRSGRDRRQTCRICGATFVAVHHNERYCSEPCRREGHAENNRVYQARYHQMRRGA